MVMALPLCMRGSWCCCALGWASLKMYSQNVHTGEKGVFFTALGKCKAGFCTGCPPHCVWSWLQQFMQGKGYPLGQVQAPWSQQWNQVSNSASWLNPTDGTAGLVLGDGKQLHLDYQHCTAGLGGTVLCESQPLPLVTWARDRHSKSQSLN